MQIVQTTPFRFSLLGLIVLLLSVGYAVAQNTLTMTGRIVDGKTGEPLPFATISIPESMTGVISNEFGEFKYHIPEKYRNDVVRITFVGYEPIETKVLEAKADQLTIYKMEPIVQQLEEVEIKGNKGKRSAVDVVSMAIKNIRKTHPGKETRLHGYYRDYVRPAQTNEYLNLLEAGVVIDDKGSDTYDSRTKIKLEQLRYKPDVAVDSSLNVAYDGRNKFIPNANLTGANELSILRAHDPIRNHDVNTFSYVYIFDTSFKANHDFQFEEITLLNSDTLYCIHFGTRVNHAVSQTEYQAEGQIYILSKDYAILKMNYAVTCTSPTYSGKFFEMKLEYKDYAGKYYLNYLSLMNYFEYRKNTANPGGPSEPYFQYRELFINRIQNKPFPAFKPHEVIDKLAPLLSNKIQENKEFWENYNYISIIPLLE